MKLSILLVVAFAAALCTALPLSDKRERNLESKLFERVLLNLIEKRAGEYDMTKPEKENIHEQELDEQNLDEQKLDEQKVDAQKLMDAKLAEKKTEDQNLVDPKPEEHKPEEQKPQEQKPKKNEPKEENPEDKPKKEKPEDKPKKEKSKKNQPKEEKPEDKPKEENPEDKLKEKRPKKNEPKDEKPIWIPDGGKKEQGGSKGGDESIRILGLLHEVLGELKHVSEQTQHLSVLPFWNIARQSIDGLNAVCPHILRPMMHAFTAGEFSKRTMNEETDGKFDDHKMDDDKFDDGKMDDGKFDDGKMDDDKFDDGKFDDGKFDDDKEHEMGRLLAGLCLLKEGMTGYLPFPAKMVLKHYLEQIIKAHN